MHHIGKDEAVLLYSVVNPNQASNPPLYRQLLHKLITFGPVPVGEVLADVMALFIIIKVRPAYLRGDRTRGSWWVLGVGTGPQQIIHSVVLSACCNLPPHSAFITKLHRRGDIGTEG